jgi:alpha-N-arabinofuranosidase
VKIEKILRPEFRNPESSNQNPVTRIQQPERMKEINLTALLISLIVHFSLAQANTENKIIIYADQGKYRINKNIYGQFSEHLGHCIYGGIWVGEQSTIPNIHGVRSDVVEALRKIKIPTLRWPGGCFADEYHWMNGIGPPDLRPKTVNSNWGGVVEDNSFGTHEFLNFCELIGAEPYISGNLGSGTVEEMADWVKYVNSEGDNSMASLRRKNGREKPWCVKFWGVGNESWGCGGNMTPEFYSDQYRRYATYLRTYEDHKLFKIASGASDYDYAWTDVLIKNLGNRMQGLSLHYYTVKGWEGSKGSATLFTRDEYISTLKKSMAIEDVLKKHLAILDKYDPEKQIGLMVDEWGTWWDVEPGTNPGFLYQQNTLRDAFVAATTLNIFNRHADRIKMANIAQMVNVLQSLILTDHDKIVLTPTYHVFDLYKVHQEATSLPFELRSEDYEYNGKKIPALSVSCSKAADGSIHLTIVNLNPDKNIVVEGDCKSISLKEISGKILTAGSLDAHNTFDHPNVVMITDFTRASLKNNILSIPMPAKSIVCLELK